MDNRDGWNPSDPNDPNNPNDPNSADSGDKYYPPYPSTPHPEDNPNFGNSGYGSQGGYDSGYGAGAGSAGYPGGGYPGGAYPGGGFTGGEYPTGVARDADEELTQATEASILGSIGFGFKRMFRSPGVFLLGTLVIVAVAAALTFATGGFAPKDSEDLDSAASAVYSVSSVVSMLFAVLIQPLIYNVVLRSLDRRKVGFKDLTTDVRYLPVLGISLLNTVIIYAVILVVIIIVALIVAVTAAASTAAAVTIGIIGGLIGLVIMFAVSVFLYLAPWFKADSDVTFGQAYRASIAAGRRYFLPLLGFYILAGLIAALMTFITLGIGILIAMPATTVATAHFYRSIARGAVPARA